MAQTSGTTQVGTIRLNYATTNVTDSAYVQLSAAIGFNANHITVFDSGGYTLIFSYGPAGSEVVAMDIPPGGFNGKIPCLLHNGMRLAVKAALASTTISAGELVINFFT